MQRPLHEDIKALWGVEGSDGNKPVDNATATRLIGKFAEHLKEQITLGIPPGADEAGLRRLAQLLRAGQIGLKLFLPYPLHAKLYLLFRDDVHNPLGLTGTTCGAPPARTAALSIPRVEASPDVPLRVRPGAEA